MLVAKEPRSEADSMPKHISPRFLAQVQVSIANRLRQCSDAIRRLSILARDDDCFGTILRNGRIRHRQRSRCAYRNSRHPFRSEEHTSELQSLMRISYAVSCLKTKKN